MHEAILTMAVPSVISMLVTSLYNMADTWYVGRISTQATAAVGIVFPIMTVIQAIGFFFGQGSGTYISRRLGAKDKENASKMASVALFSSFGMGLLLSLTGLIFLRPLSVALGSTSTILPYTKDFLGIILVGAPFMASSLTLNNQMRFQGNASLAMFGILTGAVVNVITTPLFAFSLGMGIKGAALGTVIGQICGFFMLLYMSTKGSNLKYSKREICFKKEYLKEIFKGGTPSLTRQGMASISTLLLNVAAAGFSDAAVAGMSIVNRIAFVVFSFILGLGQGFQPLCGFSYGAGLYRRVREGYFFCLGAGISFLLLLCVPGFIFADNIISVLRNDSEVILVGAQALRWQIITWPIAAMITFSNMTLQTSGHSLSANILAGCRNGFFFIPLILLLPKILGLKGVVTCQSVSDIFSLCVAVPLMIKYFKGISPDSMK